MNKISISESVYFFIFEGNNDRVFKFKCVLGFLMTQSKAFVRFTVPENKYKIVLLSTEW